MIRSILIVLLGLTAGFLSGGCSALSQKETRVPTTFTYYKNKEKALSRAGVLKEGRQTNGDEVNCGEFQSLSIDERTLYGLKGMALEAICARQEWKLLPVCQGQARLQIVNPGSVNSHCPDSLNGYSGSVTCVRCMTPEKFRALSALGVAFDGRQDNGDQVRCLNKKDLMMGREKKELILQRARRNALHQICVRDSPYMSWCPSFGSTDPFTRVLSDFHQPRIEGDLLQDEKLEPLCPKASQSGSETCVLCNAPSLPSYAEVLTSVGALAQGRQADDSEVACVDGSELAFTPEREGRYYSSKDEYAVAVAKTNAITSMLRRSPTPRITWEDKSFGLRPIYDRCKVGTVGSKKCARCSLPE